MTHHSTYARGGDVPDRLRRARHRPKGRNETGDGKFLPVIRDIRGRPKEARTSRTAV